MKAVYALAVVGLSLIGAMGAVSAQSYGERDYGSRDRDYGDRDRPRGGYGDRDRGYGDRGDRGDRGSYGDRGDRGGGGGGGFGFNEAEYLRCNPDVLRAIRNGQMKSGAAHYKVFGRREGRRLSC